MVNHIVALILLSLAVLFAMPYVDQALQMLLTMHDGAASILTNVFSGGTVGEIIRKLIAVLFVTFLIGIIPALLYWIVKRSRFPYFMHTVWVIWLIQMSALVVLHK